MTARTPYDALPSGPRSPRPPARPQAVYDGDRDGPRGGPRRATTSRAGHRRPRPRASPTVATREPGVVAGLGVAALVFHYVLGDAVDVTDRSPDGTRVRAGDVVCGSRVPPAALLTAERTALNSPATSPGSRRPPPPGSRRWRAPGPGPRHPQDARPDYRALQKYAVRCGGGVNHRFSLSDMAMVKDNHVVAAGGVVPPYARCAGRTRTCPVEVEVDTSTSCASCSRAGASDPARQHGHGHDAGGRPRAAGRATLEASGGLTLDRAREVAETGVDFISVGALTHSVKVFDLGMDLEE